MSVLATRTVCDVTGFRRRDCYCDGCDKMKEEHEWLCDLYQRRDYGCSDAEIEAKIDYLEKELGL